MGGKSITGLFLVSLGVFHNCQGVSPRRYISSSACFSLKVSTQHQNESWRSVETRPSIDLLFPLVEQEPNDPLTLRNLTTALLSSGRFKEAEPLCERMTRLAPDDSEQLAKLAWARWEVGRESDAIAAWRRAQARSPDHPAVRRIGRLLGQQ